METRTVYRVEHERECYGPFSQDDFTFNGFHDGDEFRAPWEEPRLRRRFGRGELDRYVCGCPSLDEARRWFGRFTDRLEHHGFELTIWQVPRRHIAHGRDQVMFRADRAECVARLPVSVLNDD